MGDLSAGFPFSSCRFRYHGSVGNSFLMMLMS
jgi:hypothetical protein